MTLTCSVELMIPTPTLVLIGALKPFEPLDEASDIGENAKIKKR